MTAYTIIPANGAPVTDVPFHARHLIEGVWQGSADRQVFDPTSPSHGTVVSQSALGGEVEVIAAARSAFGTWSAQSGKARAAAVLHVAVNLKKAVAFEPATETRITA